MSADHQISLQIIIKLLQEWIQIMVASRRIQIRLDSGPVKIIQVDKKQVEPHLESSIKITINNKILSAWPRKFRDNHFSQIRKEIKTVARFSIDCMDKRKHSEKSLGKSSLNKRKKEKRKNYLTWTWLSKMGSPRREDCHPRISRHGLC